MRYKLRVFEDGTCELRKKYIMWPFWMYEEMPYKVRDIDTGLFEWVDDRQRFNTRSDAETAMKSYIAYLDIIHKRYTPMLDIPIDVV